MGQLFKSVSNVVAGSLLDVRGTPFTGPVAIGITDGSISRISDVGESRAVIGGANCLVAPGFVNAHDHGRGLRRLAYGASDDALELWLPNLAATHPPVDPYLIHAVAFARMAASGVTSVVHCHVPTQNDILAEAEAVTKAARDVGIRLAFVAPMRDQNMLAYGGDEEFVSRLDPADQTLAREFWLKSTPSVEEQVAVVRELARRFAGTMINVQFGPMGDCWVSRHMLQAVAAESEASGLRIHMHSLETTLQREWVDANYSEGYFNFLDEIGFLSPRLTLAHGVWLRADECTLLAKRGVMLSLNTSSNLRLRSGLAPVGQFISSGVDFGIGMDGLTLDDDEDYIREIRLSHRIHSGVGFKTLLTGEQALKAATRNGARAVTGRNDFGVLTPGSPADMVVFNWEELTRDVIPGLGRPLDLFMARASARHVMAVVCAGNLIIDNEKPVGVDLGALERELCDQVRFWGETVRTRTPLVRRVQDELRAYYRCGCHRTKQ